MPDSPSARRWQILLLLMALCFISHFNRISMSTAGEERIMHDYGLSTKKMGWVYSGFLIVYTASMALGGAFIDRVGVRAALTVMAIASGIFAMLTGTVGFAATGASFFITLLLVRSVMGFVTT